MFIYKIVVAATIALCVSCATLARVDKDSRQEIYNQLNSLLRNQDSFPKRSPQYRDLSDFRKSLRKILLKAGCEAKPGGKSQDQDSDSPVLGDDIKTNITISSVGAPDTPSEPKKMGMKNYVNTLRQHKTLNQELADVNTLKAQVDKTFSDLITQLDILKKHNASMRAGGDIPADYDDVLDKYETIDKDYKAIQVKYREALSQYNQHKAEYAALLREK